MLNKIIVTNKSYKYYNEFNVILKNKTQNVQVLLSVDHMKKYSYIL